LLSFVEGLMGLVFPKYLSDFVTDKVRKELGVDIRPERLVKGFEKKGDKVVIRLDNGDQVEADHVGEYLLDPFEAISNFL
jgi:hypothetical protein